LLLHFAVLPISALLEAISLWFTFFADSGLFPAALLLTS
jgi:hypothetical protein